jgi:hypothetical protein
MKHLKLFEDFDTDFGHADYQKLSNEEFSNWVNNWREEKKYLSFDTRDECLDFLDEISNLCKNYIKKIDFNKDITEFRENPLNGKNFVDLNIIVISVYGTGQFIDIRPFVEGDNKGFVVSIFGPNANRRRFETADAHYKCLGTEEDHFEGLRFLLEDLMDKNYFTKEVKPKPQKAYKNEPVLMDGDFTERGMDNQMRSQFYKEQGRMVRDLQREEALKVLDEWVTKNI